jgi:hypothetical protein
MNDTPETERTTTESDMFPEGFSAGERAAMKSAQRSSRQKPARARTGRTGSARY